MSKTTGAQPPDTERAPKMTAEQMEGAILHLLAGQHNTVAALIARPEKVQALRERFARATRNEAKRIGEAAERVAAETLRR